jgi:hypothetical protein
MITSFTGPHPYRRSSTEPTTARTHMTEADLR